MLKDITVKNYRLFKELKIDNFARVNLIVGNNNSGKTSLLEAIYLLVNQGEIGSLAEILNTRGEKYDRYEENSLLGTEIDRTSTRYQIGHLFGYQNGGDSPIYLESQRAENGCLLVDEIDISLYYMTQTYIWEFLLQIALDFNVQIFATTHSWDCICAFQEALENLEDSTVGKVLRLQWRGEHFRTVDYPGDKLGIAVRQSIEVR